MEGGGEEYVIRFEFRLRLWMQGVLDVAVVIGRGGRGGRGSGHSLFRFARFGPHCVGGGVGTGGTGGG